QASGDVTGLLLRWRQGDEAALERLMPIIYDELRRIASRHLRRERKDHTLETSALVHEAYVRLVDQRRAQWKDRAHFFAIASRMMRRVLVDHARRRSYLKREGRSRRVMLEEFDALAAPTAPDWLALDEALDGLSAVRPEHG